MVELEVQFGFYYTGYFSRNTNLYCIFTEFCSNKLLLCTKFLAMHFHKYAVELNGKLRLK